MPIIFVVVTDPVGEGFVAGLPRPGGNITEPGGGLIVMPDFFMLTRSGPIILLAARNNVPAVYPWRFVVAKDGGLLSYGPDLGDIFRRGAP
ncbi:MAG: hypothetical protein E6G74_01270 [Alphaproteobacteria bacterium]|nr:MAG: hypothetical protein E6G74_01270 [Alphaproteobacteria bacterium]